MTDLKIVQQLVLFFAGALASLALNVLLGEAFQEILPSWSIAALVLTIVAILVIDVQLVSLINSRVGKAFAELEGKNLIVIEPDIEQNNRAETCYRELEKLVQSAEKSIFIVPNAFREGEIQSWDQKPRKKYMSTLEKKVKSNIDLKYTRIQQAPEISSDSGEQKTLKDNIGEVATEHMANMLKDSPTDNVSFFRISCDEISGFMVIDDKILVKFITAGDSRMHRKLVAITIQQDYIKTTSMEKFCQGLPSVLSKTQTTKRITIEDLR